MYDWLWVTIKIGDQRTTTGKEHLGVKDGMVVDFIDPNDPNYGPDYFPSEWMRTVFLNVKIQHQYLDNLKNWVMPVGDETDTENYRSRGRLIRFGEFPAAAQNKIRNALDNGKVLDLTQQYAAWLFPDGTRQESSTWTSNQVKQLFVSSSVLNPPAYDANAISGGNTTIGSGGAYATIAAFTADLTTQTSDIVATLVSSITETAANQIQHDFAGYKISIVGNYAGNPSSAYKITWNYDRTYLFVNIDGHHFIADGLYHELGVSMVNSSQAIYSTDETGTYVVKNSLIDGQNRATAVGVYFFTDTKTIEVYNTEIINCATSGIDSRVGNAIFENVTITDCGLGIRVGGTTTCRNVTSHGNTTNWAFIAGHTTTFQSCGTGGAGAIGATSESGTVNGVSDTDFESVLVAGGANFLLPTEAGGLYGAGSNPTISGHTTYINDVDIVTDDVDIGAKGLERITGVYGTGTPSMSALTHTGAGYYRAAINDATGTPSMAAFSATGLGKATIDDGTGSPSFPSFQGVGPRVPRNNNSKFWFGFGLGM